jgi:hypothetical protein
MPDLMELTWVPDHTGEQLWAGGTYLGCIYQRPESPLRSPVFDADWRPAGSSAEIARPGCGSEEAKQAARNALEIDVYTRNLVPTA